MENEIGKPMMSDDDINIIEAVFLDIGAGILHVKDLNILEWGSGNSTLHFSKLIKQYNYGFRWDTIEHDVKWYLYVQENNKLVEVKCHLFMEDNPQDKKTMQKAEVHQYVNMPRSIGLKYDVIIIDGCQRNKCLILAERFLKPNGIILLHDAEREEYHEDIKRYDGKYLSKTLWIGKLK